MGDLQPAARVDALPLYPVERAELLDLLSDLKANEWALPPR